MFSSDETSISASAAPHSGEKIEVRSGQKRSRGKRGREGEEGTKMRGREKKDKKKREGR